MGNQTLTYRLNWIRTDFPKKVFLVIIPTLVFVAFPAFFAQFSILPQNFLFETELGIKLGLIGFLLGLLSQLILVRKFPAPLRKLDATTCLILSTYLLVINAFSEELFSRWFLQNIVTFYTQNPVFSILITSAIFSYSHVLLYGWKRARLLAAFLAGLYFGTIYQISGSFLAVWIIHGFIDLGAITDSVGSFVIWRYIKSPPLMLRESKKRK